MHNGKYSESDFAGFKTACSRPWIAKRRLSNCSSFVNDHSKRFSRPHRDSVPVIVSYPTPANYALFRRVCIPRKHFVGFRRFAGAFVKIGILIARSFARARVQCHEYNEHTHVVKTFNTNDTWRWRLRVQYRNLQLRWQQFIQRTCLVWYLQSYTMNHYHHHHSPYLAAVMINEALRDRACLVSGKVISHSS